MFRLEIMSPLPSILGFSEQDRTLVLEYPFQEDLTLNLLLERLCADYPLLDAKRQQNQEIFQEYLLVVNNKAAFTPEDMRLPLADNSVIVMVAPYQGG